MKSSDYHIYTEFSWTVPRSICFKQSQIFQNSVRVTISFLKTSGSLNNYFGHKKEYNIFQYPNDSMQLANICQEKVTFYSLDEFGLHRSMFRCRNPMFLGTFVKKMQKHRFCFSQLQFVIRHSGCYSAFWYPYKNNQKSAQFDIVYISQAIKLSTCIF